MTRIFDALKKAEGTAEPSPPPPTPAPLGATPRPVGRAPEVGRTALPLLGVVPMSEEVVRSMSSLRVGLEAALGARTTRTVLFLGSQGGEGTSTVALQFAQAIAHDTGARPLLVDANARRPAYSVEEGQRCAVLDRRFMTGSPETSAVIASNLFVVPVPPSARAGGMIPPGLMREVLDANTPGFDWVILDGPPVLDSPDAAALGSIADGVVLVLQAGRTKRPVMTRSADLLTKSGARLLGTVLNRRVLEIPEFIYRRI
jgi:Mrp family chromosome partitioning ATPase